MKWVTRKPSLGEGRFSKSIAGVCSLTVLCSPYAANEVATLLIAPDGDRRRCASGQDRHASGEFRLGREAAADREAMRPALAARFRDGIGDTSFPALPRSASISPCRRPGQATSSGARSAHRCPCLTGAPGEWSSPRAEDVVPRNGARDGGNCGVVTRRGGEGSGFASRVAVQCTSKRSRSSAEQAGGREPAARLRRADARRGTRARKAARPRPQRSAASPWSRVGNSSIRTAFPRRSVHT
jgi:hypothetical protein